MQRTNPPSQEWLVLWRGLEVDAFPFAVSFLGDATGGIRLSTEADAAEMAYRPAPSMHLLRIADHDLYARVHNPRPLPLDMLNGPACPVRPIGADQWLVPVYEAVWFEMWLLSAAWWAPTATWIIRGTPRYIANRQGINAIR